MHHQARARLSVILLVAVAVAVPAACGGKSPPPAEPPEVEPAPAAEPPITNGVDAGSLDEHRMPDGSMMPGHEHDESMR